MTSSRSADNTAVSARQGTGEGHAWMPTLSEEKDTLVSQSEVTVKMTMPKETLSIQLKMLAHLQKIISKFFLKIL